MEFYKIGLMTIFSLKKLHFVGPSGRVDTASKKVHILILFNLDATKILTRSSEQRVSVVYSPEALWMLKETWTLKLQLYKGGFTQNASARFHQFGASVQKIIFTVMLRKTRTCVHTQRERLFCSDPFVRRVGRFRQRFKIWYLDSSFPRVHPILMVDHCCKLAYFTVKYGHI